MTMTIENYEGTADKFTWPNNPTKFDAASINNFDVYEYPLSNLTIMEGSGGIRPRTIILAGEFHGSSKITYYRSMAKHFRETTKLKKLVWESGKFYLGLGKSVKQTNVGGRTNFIDYVVSFQTLIGLLWSTTQKTSGTNEGNATTYVEQITGTVNNGAVDVTFADNHGTTRTIAAADLATGDVLTYYFVYMADQGGGVYMTNYHYINRLRSGVNTQITSEKIGDGRLKIDAAENVSTITPTNLTASSIKFRDAWYE